MDIPGQTHAIDEVAAEAAAHPEGKQTIYVWDMPVRITHWVNVASIVLLSATGYYIMDPFFSLYGVAANEYLMGTIRFVHFVAAFFFTASVVFRIYWSFASHDRYARWNQFLPASRARAAALWKMIKYYTFINRDPPAEIGHNPLAGATYIGVYVLFILQIITGFALFSLPLHDGLIKGLFGWIVVWLGVQPLRLIHTILMFLFLAFTIHHVYSAILIDIEERSGLLSSIVTGNKTLSNKLIAEAKMEERTRRARKRGRGRG